MARQAIPRFDLYAALGVDPSADDAAIEAAYWDLFGQYGGDAEASDDRRIVRARLAREWLTDPDRRSRYDASRARAAARAAAKSAAGGAAAAGAAGAAGAADAADAAEDVDDEIAEDTIPWPAADLGRQAAEERRAAAEAAERLAEVEAAEQQAELDRRAAEIEQSESSIKWSATPAEPIADAARRRSRSQRSRLRYVGWAAIIVAAIAAVYLIYNTLGSTGVAVNDTPTPPPAATTPPATPTLLPPTLEPTVAPTAPPPTAPGIDTAALQQSSWNTLQSLIAAAADGDVETAQTFLGDTAQGLRASGLRRAAFPSVTADQMTVSQDLDGYLAVADDTSRLTSADGTTWTFHYGDRPLAVYRGGTTPHDLWWTTGKVKHHIYLRITFATVSKGSVSVTAKWSYDPSLPNDATYFQNAEFKISAATFDGTAIPIVPDTNAMSATNITRAAFTVDQPIRLPDELELTMWVTPDGNSARAVETDFVLTVR